MEKKSEIMLIWKTVLKMWKCHTILKCVANICEELDLTKQYLTAFTNTAAVSATKIN